MCAQVNVGVGIKNPTHDISLSDGQEKWGIKLEGGIRGVQEVSQTASTILQRGGAQKWGDYDPTFGHIQQDTWHGGRGQEEFSDDPTRYFDSKNAWTLTPGRLCPSMLWSICGHIHTANDLLQLSHSSGEKRPDLHWMSLRSSEKYIAVDHDSTTSNFTVDGIWIWIRRVGRPAGTLTCSYYSDNSGEPGTIAHADATSTVTVSTITDYEAVLHYFKFTTGFAQTASTKYWWVVHDTGTGTAANHWEVGYSTTGTHVTGKSSSDGSTWATSTKKIFGHAMVAKNPRKFHFFDLEGGLYAAEEADDGTASHLWVNGDRGIATAGAATTLTDSTKAWETNAWSQMGAWAKIVKGTGKGQYRAIASNTATALTVATWAVNPDTTSEYVIYGCNYWADITPTGEGDLIDGVVADVATFDNIAIFAQGASVNMLKMKWNSATPGHLFDDDGTNKGDRVRTFYDPVDGPQVWRAENDTVDISRSDVKAWGTDLAFGTEIDIGDHSFGINRLIDYNDQLWVIKEDSIWSVKNDRASRLNVGLESAAGPYTGIGACASNLFLYFGWSQSLERLYGGTLDDIGPWKDAGLPNNRQGYISALEPVYSWIFAAIDAGTDGTSSILCHDGTGWHEIFRAPKSGYRIRSLKWQHCPFRKPILWFDCGGMMCFMEFPQDTLNPLHDADLNYNHEFSLETATFTMGAERLPKLFKELNFITEGLGTSGNIAVDYKVDEDIGDSTSKWTEVTTIYHSPDDVIPLNLGNKRRIRFRIRARTSDADKPPKIIATVLECLARTPSKRQWNMRVKIGDLQRTKTGAQDHDPRDFYNWLKNASQSAAAIFMRANDELMDEIFVIIEPPGLFRTFLNTIQSWLGGVVTLTVREA